MSVTQPDAALPLDRLPAVEAVVAAAHLRVLRTFARRSPMSAFWGCIAAANVVMAVAAPVRAEGSDARRLPSHGEAAVGANCSAPTRSAAIR